MRPGLGWDGLAKLQAFVQKGGVLLTATDTSRFATETGLSIGVSTSSSQKLKIVGSVLGARLVDGASPIAYGYDEKLSVYCDNGPIFSLSSVAGARGRRRLGPESHSRPRGGGSVGDRDFTGGRSGVEAREEPSWETWKAMPATEEQGPTGSRVTPPANRPRVIFR